MTTTITPGAYVAVQSDEDEGNAVLGVVELAKNGKLTALIVEEAGKATLPKLVDYMNGKTVLEVEVAPPEGSPRHAKVTADVLPGQPEYLPAVVDYLARYYDVQLEPAPPGSLPVGVGPQEEYRDDPYMDLPADDTPPPAEEQLEMPEPSEPEPKEPVT